MKISFILTTYNLPATFIKECVESIVSLSLRPSEREILLIDDGSDYSQLNSLGQLRNNVTYLWQTNSGLSAARNRGIDLATGDYLQFVDADDALVTTVYEHCLDIVRYNNPDVVMFNATTTQNARTSFTVGEPMTGADYMKSNNLHACAWGYIFKTSLLGTLRFKEGLLHEDELFTPQLLLKAERLFVSDADAYFYRRRSDSITSRKDESHIEKRLDDMEKILLDLYATAQTFIGAEREAMDRRVAQLTMDCLFNEMKFKKNAQSVEAMIERLRQNGLYPLPAKNYSKKYALFRRAVQNRIIRRLMTWML